jgi:hypothetical protein
LQNNVQRDNDQKPGKFNKVDDVNSNIYTFRNPTCIDETETDVEMDAITKTYLDLTRGMGLGDKDALDLVSGDLI